MSRVATPPACRAATLPLAPSRAPGAKSALSAYLRMPCLQRISVCRGDVGVGVEDNYRPKGCQGCACERRQPSGGTPG